MTNEEILDRLNVFAQPIQQGTEEFKRWSGGAEVIDSYDVNDFNFSGEGPFVIKAYHGTTHQFDVFDASIRENKGGHFGA